MPKKMHIQKIAILGAGTMGSQIAARLAAEGIPILLFDLPSDAQPNGKAQQALKHLQTLTPKPLAHPNHGAWIKPKSMAHDLDALKDCDLIIEAVFESIQAKKQCYEHIIPFISDQAILVSNTSGLAINTLAKTLPESIMPRFFGVHWFNPPRYLPLIEMIPHHKTDKACMHHLRDWMENTLGKTVLVTKDTPNFIANRMGCMGLLLACKHGAKHKLTIETIDAITGTMIGHPKSATFRTLDWVGLDIFASVVNTMTHTGKQDPWQSEYTLPKSIQQLIEKGYLGQKTGQGLYKKTNEGIMSWSFQHKRYQAKEKASSNLLNLKKRWKKDPLGCLTTPKNNPESQFLSDWFRDFFHYAAYHAVNIAHQTSDIDLAMRKGFQWQEGPFETWQRLGWSAIQTWLHEGIQAKKTTATAPLPSWLDAVAKQGAYRDDQCFSFDEKQYIMPTLAQRKTKAFPEGEVIEDHADMRLWHQNDAVLIASLKTKMHTLNPGVLTQLNLALDLAEKDFSALVIYPEHGQPFSAGADIKSLAMAYLFGGSWKLKGILNNFQTTFERIQQARIPCVAAVDGYALGGGCELMMHCHQTVASLNSVIGLVETAIGLIPGAGGLKMMAARASNHQNPNIIQQYFEQIAQAKIGTSPYEAMDMGYLTPKDRIIHNPKHLLDAAKESAISLSKSGWHAHKTHQITVAGPDEKALCLAKIHAMHAGNFASDHDARVATHLAHVLTGGGREAGLKVAPSWYFSLERDAFLALCKTKATRARIKHMAKTGKPLRN